MTTIEAFAPAKINLTLHVTGKRADGYHLLDSLVVFADVGDVLRMSYDDRISLQVTGPKAAEVPQDGDNLVLRAAHMFGAPNGAAIVLEKFLPAAAGIGGGSSDAAAALRGLAHLWSFGLPRDVARLGADVPVCLQGRPCRMRGIGEELGDVPRVPPLWAVLVNPGVPVPTREVFAKLESAENAPMSDTLPAWPGQGALIEWLATQRNDLQTPATLIAPVIGDVIEALAASEGCALARMSGSGATCFGLYTTQEEARSAETALRRAHPDWWVQRARLGLADVAIRTI